MLIVPRSRNPVPFVSFFNPSFIVYMSHVDLNDRDREEDYNGGRGEGDNLAKKSEKLACGDFFCVAILV